jgi:hypothetical protein
VNHIYDIGFCEPKTIERTRDSLGDFLTGSYRTNSKFRVERFKYFKHKQLCSLNLSKSDQEKWKSLISSHGRVEVFIDGKRITYRLGKIGSKSKKVYYRKHIGFRFWYNTNGHLTRVSAKAQKGNWSLLTDTKTKFPITYGSTPRKSEIKSDAEIEHPDLRNHLFPLLNGLLLSIILL